MTTYPARIDNTTSVPLVVDGQSPAQGSFINNTRNALIAVETELGVKPSATYATVRARLDAIENAITSISGGTITLAGDLGGTTVSPKVIGIQGRPVSSTAPTSGYVLTWNGVAWIPAAIPSGSSITLGGDLGGTTTSQLVIGLQGRPLASTAPSVGQAITWNGTTWLPSNVSQDFVDAAYLISLALSGASVVEVSQPVNNPLFNATYNYTPITAVLSDSDGNSQSVIGFPTLFSSNYSFVKNTFGAVVTFTLTSNNGLVTKMVSVPLTWGQKIFWGVGAAGGNNAAFIQALAGQSTTLTKATSFTVAPSGSQKIYYAHRTAYGTATFSVNGIEGGFETVSTTISVTNAFGFTENYTLYESDNLGLGSTTVTVV